MPWTSDDLLVGEKYTVEETNADGLNALYTLVAEESATKVENVEITVDGAVAELINKYVRKTGDLEITKTVVSPIPAEEEKEFTFTILLNEKITAEYDVEGGDEGEKASFTNGKATITVKGKQTKTIKGLPQGVSYTVVEAIDNQFTAENQQLGGEIAATAGSASFWNIRKTGDLIIKKTVKSSTAEDLTKEFKFTVTLNDETITGPFDVEGGETDETISFTNGEATIVVAGGSQKTIKGLPTGVTYTVEEKTENGFVPTYAGETGTICTAPSTASITNTKDEGGLIVSKSVVSDVEADKDIEFTFTVTLKDGTIKGTYGDMEFTDSVATFKLKDGESKSASGLPKGIEYEVEETPNELFETTSVNAEGKTAENANVAAFTNTRKTGELEISKTVVSDIPAEQTKAYTFDVELSVGEQILNGVYSGITFTEGKATVTVLGGASLTITGVPVGTTYKITETGADDFTVTVGETETTEASGATTLEEPNAAVEFTNKRKVGDLEISKTVVSPIPAEEEKEFTFTILLNEKITAEYDVEGGKTAEKVSFTEGKATITVKGKQTKTIKGLPQGVSYTVVEAIDNQFTAESQQLGGEIAATAGSAAFTNTRKVGDLIIKKTVVSSIPDELTKEFTFTVTLGDATITGPFDVEGGETGEKITFTAGSAEIKVKGGSQKTIKGLPTGVTYTVAEQAESGFVPTSSGETGTICLSESIAAFTNTKKEGNLIITKRVNSAVTTDHDPAQKKFAFTVQLKPVIEGTFGEVTFDENGLATFELGDGENKVITGLPLGTEYTVTETTDSDFISNVNGTESNTTKGKIEEKEGTIETGRADFTNIRKVGKLTLKKLVKSPSAADEAAVYQFTVTLKDYHKDPLNGEFGGYNFEGGKILIGLHMNESVTISQIPYGSTYEVAEIIDSHYNVTIENASGTIDKDHKEITATATNERALGDLAISKTVSSPIAADATREFTFTIQLSELVKDGDYEVEGGEGGETVHFTKSSATIKVKGGQTKTIKGLPKDVTFTVTEAKEAYFNADSAVLTGTVGGETAAFTNTREEGGLDVTKTVDSTTDEDRTDKEFNFTVTLTFEGKPLSGAFGGITFDANGQYKFTLKHSLTKQFKELPAGVQYLVEEETDTGFATVKTGDTGIIVKENIAKAEFTNIRKEGGLVVSKKVISPVKADHEKQFTFKVELDDESVTGTFGEITFTKGVSEEFKLADGEYKVIIGLPEDVTYTVTEQGTDENGFAFTVEYSGQTGTIAEDVTAHATVTNNRKTGALSILKTVVSPMDEDNNELFGFTVTLTADSGEPLNGKYGGYTFGDGTVQIWLKNGETATIQQIPVGTNWTVAENANDRYEVKLKVDNAEIGEAKGTIAEKDDGTIPTVSVEVINNRNLGNLVIKKTFNGIPEGSDEITKNLEFKVYGPYGLVKINDEDGKLTYGDFDEDGTYTFTGLPTGDYVVYELNAYGLSGSWMMLKSSVTSGETTVATGETANIELENNYKLPKTSATVRKVWDDEDDLDGSRPETLKVTLYRNDEAIKTVELSEKNKWMAEEKELLLYDQDENEYVYTWKEETVKNYKLVSTEIFGNFTELTNKHEPKLTVLTVRKVWDDNENAAGLRPTSLAVTLYNGNTPVQTVLLNEDNHWAASIADLPTVIDGEKAKYNWKEQDVLGYRSSVSQNGDVTTFTNTYKRPRGTKPKKAEGICIINHVGDCYD